MTETRTMIEVTEVTEVTEVEEVEESKKLNVGVDVSKDSLDVAFWDEERDEAVYQGKFTNDKKGFQTIAQKIEHRRIEIGDTSEDISGDTAETISIIMVMEPTGGYEQPFARFAIQSEWRVSLPNPYHVKQWAGSMGIRAKTDRHDARTLAHFAFSRKLHQWKPPPPEVEQLDHLLSRLDDMKDILRREKNRAHAYQYRTNTHRAATKNMKQTIAFLERHIIQINKAIREHLKAHPHLQQQRKLLLTISGVGEKNVLYILVIMHRWEALTDGEGDARSLVAYIGLDPQPHESGTSIRRRASISRQGNRKFRSRLYMSALGGIKGNNPLRIFYKRLVGRGKQKKVALVASARKILVWSWAVFRTNTPFDTTRFQIAQ